MVNFIKKLFWRKHQDCSLLDETLDFRNKLEEGNDFDFSFTANSLKEDFERGFAENPQEQTVIFSGKHVFKFKATRTGKDKYHIANISYLYLKKYENPFLRIYW